MDPMRDLTVGEYAERAAPIMLALAKEHKLPEPKAVELYGRLIGLLDDRLPSLEACERFLRGLKLKPLEHLTQAEIRVAFILGYVVPKTKPFVAGSASAVGRNEPCPCKSGLKFKNCCLNESRKWDSAQLKKRLEP